LSRRRPSPHPVVLLREEVFSCLRQIMNVRPVSLSQSPSFFPYFLPSSPFLLPLFSYRGVGDSQFGPYILSPLSPTRPPLTQTKRLNDAETWGRSIEVSSLRFSFDIQRSFFCSRKNPEDRVGLFLHSDCLGLRTRRAIQIHSSRFPLFFFFSLFFSNTPSMDFYWKDSLPSARFPTQS